MPFQVSRALPPAPDLDRTVLPAASVTRAVQRVAPVAARVSFVESSVPSPLGEMSLVDTDFEVRTGATVSTVTA